MMTSALLNMLDTPEEAAEHYIFQDPNQRFQDPNQRQDLYELDPNMFQGLSLNSSRREPSNYHDANVNDPSSWSPSWQPTTTEGRPPVFQLVMDEAGPNDSTLVFTYQSHSATFATNHTLRVIRQPTLQINFLCYAAR
jgi:hypothetical protein